MLVIKYTMNKKCADKQFGARGDLSSLFSLLICSLLALTAVQLCFGLFSGHCQQTVKTGLALSIGSRGENKNMASSAQNLELHGSLLL